MSTADQIDKPAARGAAIALGIIAVLALLSCCGCVTAPNSNLSLNFNFFGSFSRIVEAIGGTNSKPTGASEGGGGNGAHASLTP